MNKTIAIITAVLVVLVLLVWFKPDTYTELERRQSDAFVQFKDIDFDRVAKISLQSGKSAPVSFHRKGTTWVAIAAFGKEFDGEFGDELDDDVARRLVAAVSSPEPAHAAAVGAIAALRQVSKYRITGDNKDSDLDAGDQDAVLDGSIRLLDADGRELAERRFAAGADAESPPASESAESAVETIRLRFRRWKTMRIERIDPSAEDSDGTVASRDATEPYWSVTSAFGKELSGKNRARLVPASTKNPAESASGALEVEGQLGALAASDEKWPGAADALFARALAAIERTGALEQAENRPDLPYRDVQNPALAAGRVRLIGVGGAVIAERVFPKSLFAVDAPAVTPVDVAQVSRVVFQFPAREHDATMRRKKAWIVTAPFEHRADRKTMEKILASLAEIESGEERAKSSESHEHFEVDAFLGRSISLEDAGGATLGSIVVGKRSQSTGSESSNTVFARFGAEDATFLIDSDVRTKAFPYGDEVERKNYIDKQLFKLPVDAEVFEARIARTGAEDLVVERQFGPVAVTPKDGEAGDGDEPKTEDKEYFVVISGSERQRVDSSKEWRARDIFRLAESLRCEDLAPTKEPSEYGLSEPQMRGTFRYRKKDDERAEPGQLTILFGNAIKDEQATNTDYYFSVEGVPALTGKVFVLRKWTFEQCDKKLADFLPDPKKPDDAAGDTEGDAAPPGSGAIRGPELPPTPTDAVEGPGAAGESPPAAGESPPAAGESPPAAGESPPATGESPPAAGESPPAAGESPPAAGDARPGTESSAPTPAAPEGKAAPEASPAPVDKAPGESRG